MSMSEWKEVTIGEISILKNGRKRPTKKGNVPVYGGNGIMDSVNTHNEEDCIAIGRVGAYCGCVYLAKGKVWISDNAISAKANENADNVYLYYLLSSLNLNRHRIGGAQPLMTQDLIGRIKVQLPPIEEQRRIASILSALDDKIAVNRRICENLESQAQALFKHWFIDFAPFKDGKFVESELGMIPEGWKVRIVDCVCKIFTGKKNTNQAEEKGLYPFFSCSPKPLASNDYLYDGYAVIIAGNGSYTGRTQIYQGRFDLYQRTYACVAKEKSFDINIIFIYYMMKKFFEREKMGGTRGTSIPYIVMKDITHQSFCYNKEWIEKFSNTVKPMLEQQFKMQEEIKRLSTLRDTLLPKLMSGQIKV